MTGDKTKKKPLILKKKVIIATIVIGAYMAWLLQSNPLSLPQITQQIAGKYTLKNLTDTTVQNPSDGQVLIYKNNAWKNKFLQGDVVLNADGITKLTGNFVRSVTNPEPQVLSITTTDGTVAIIPLGTTDAFIQNGNAFGKDAVLGTTDKGNLNIITNGTTRAIFDFADNNGLIFPTGVTMRTQSGNINLAASTVLTSGHHMTLSDNTSELHFRGPSSGTTYMGFKGPGSNPTASIVWALPSSDGGSGQVLTTNGSAALSWLTPLTAGGTGVNGGWTLAGNTGTTAGTNFIGTNDSQAFVFKTNGTERGRFLNGYTLQLGDGTAASTLQTTSGQGLSITSDTTGTLTLDSGSTGTVKLGTGTNAKTITLGNSTGATGVTINSGTTGNTLTSTATTNNALTVTASSSTTGNALAINTTSTSPVSITRTGSGNWMTMSYGLTSTQNFGMYNTLGTPEGATFANAGSLNTDTASGRVYVKTTGISVNTGWIELSQTDKAPIGSITSYGGTSAPAGYLMADGSAVSRTTYSLLFTAIGTAYGSGDGSTTFNLPDLRGRFVRGTDNMGTGAAGRDPNAGTRTAAVAGGNTGNNVGSVQTDATKLPNGGFTTNSSSTNTPATAVTVNGTLNQTLGGAASGQFAEGNGSAGVNTGFSASGTVPSMSVPIPALSVTGGDSETRPVNIYVNFMIKAIDTPAGAAPSFMNHINDSIGGTYIRTEQTANENYLRFGTNSTERFTIDNTGKAGIGTTAPNNKLEVSDTTTTNVAKFDGSGGTQCTIVTGTGISCSSDVKLKNITGAFGKGLDAIEGISPISFTWKDGGNGQTIAGFAAQNVQDFIPEAVTTDSNGALSLSDRPILAAAVNAIKEVNTKVAVQSLQIEKVGGAVGISKADLDKIKNDYLAGAKSAEADKFAQMTAEWEKMKENYQVTLASATQSGTLAPTVSPIPTPTAEGNPLTKIADVITTFFSKLVTITNNMIAFLTDVTFKGHVSVSEDTAGTVTIPAGQTIAHVTFKKEYAVKPVINLTLSHISDVKYAVENINTKGFDVIIDPKQDKEVTMNWTAFATDRDTISPSITIIPAQTVTVSPTQEVTETPADTEALTPTVIPNKTVSPTP
jgi:microcystin-dependent protein